MKLELRVNDAAAALRITSSFAGGLIDVMNYAVVRPAENSRLSASLLGPDGTVTVEFDGRFLDGDSAVIHASTVAGLLAKLASEETATIETKNNRMTLRAGKHRYSLPLPPDIGASICDPVRPTGDLITVPADRFLDMVSFCAHSMGQKDVRPYFNGMNFVYEGGVLKAQASDGYRLAVAHENIEASPGVSPAGMIVHNQSIRKLLPVIPKQGSVVIGFSDRFYVGMEDGTRFSFVCIAQRYPDVERILPFEDTVIGTVDSGVMLRSIERAQFVCRGVETKFPYIRVALTGSGDSGEIRLSFGSEDTTEFDERLHAQVAAEAEIKINTAYFREIFAALGGSVAMNCNSEGRPVIFKNPQRPGRTGLVAQIS